MREKSLVVFRGRKVGFLIFQGIILLGCGVGCLEEVDGYVSFGFFLFFWVIW
jgi:hypothetical protein